MIHALEAALEVVVSFGIVIFELIGVAVLIGSGIRGVYDLFKHNPSIRLNLAQGMALGLSFKLGGEILRTVVVKDPKDILAVAAIIGLRAALAYLIHWEIKVEKAEDH